MNTDTNKPNDPIKVENEVQQSKDPKIDQDVPGFPHKPSSDEELKEKDPHPKAYDRDVVDGGPDQAKHS